jgi:hypothetical protein
MGRWMLVLMMALGGCAEPRRPIPPSPLTTSDPRYIPPLTEADLERRRRAEAAAALDAQARAVCEARGRMAAAQYPSRGRGVTGGVVSGIEAGAAGAQVQAACMDGYAASGVMPSL